MTPVSELNAATDCGGEVHSARQPIGSSGCGYSRDRVGMEHAHEGEREIDQKDCAVAMQYYHPNFVREDPTRLQLLHRRVLIFRSIFTRTVVIKLFDKDYNVRVLIIE